MDIGTASCLADSEHLAGSDLAVKAEMRTLILAERRQASREFSKTHVGE